MDDHRPKKVVILGGGLAALTTAFELTNRQDWRRQFSSIAIYQIGWRLGGKAATGRNAENGRLEQIGSQVWGGFYDHAFRLMQDCYRELARDANEPLATWRDAFIPQETFTVYDAQAEKSPWWPLTGRPNDESSGEPPTQHLPWDYISNGMQLAMGWWRRLSELGGPRPRPNQDDLQTWTGQWMEYTTEFTRHLGAAVEFTRQPEPLIAATLDAMDQTHETLRNYMKPLRVGDDAIRRLWVSLDLTLTAARGALRDRAVIDGFDVLDDVDIREWLRRHGASPLTLKSALLDGLYDWWFASSGKDPSRASLAAGVALRLLCRLTFDSAGFPFWKMRAGAGDVVFAPLYEVLRRRGVQFHFFHRVRNLRLNSDGSAVDAIELDRQATLIAGEYQPLIDVKNLPCWPNSPRYDQLREGAELQKRQIDLESAWTDWKPVEQIQLRAGKDFDAIVLGISLAALPQVGSDLIAASPEWQQMVAQIPTVQSAVTQLWFDRSLDELGSSVKSPIVSSLPSPLDTWIDTSQTIPWEAWPSSSPASIAQLRGIFPDADSIPAPHDHGFPEREKERAIGAALKWFRQHAATLWPKLDAGGGQLHWEFLVDPKDGNVEERFRAQFHRANINGSDRYVQSVAGSTRFRVSAARAWFGNLYVCGDWTRTVLDLGCAEAAVMSGLLSASAVRGEAAPQGLERDAWLTHLKGTATEALAPAEPEAASQTNDSAWHP